MVHALAVLGSASDVGKSLVTAGLCRLLTDEGLSVAPFKAQNMANQAGVTADGLEMPRAQILQAQACRIPPEVDMGPVLMKPVSPTGAQIVVLGKAQGNQEASAYFRDTSALREVALGALDRLARRFDVIVMEGAGSPVEVNLMDRDYVNLVPARHLDAGLVLVVDIHKGGVFAQAKGTLDLLPPADRARVLGLVVNRFKGDPTLFEEGITQLEALCGVPVLALVPHLEHGLDEEDRPLRIPVDALPLPGKLHVGALLSSRISNTEDLFPLLAEPDVQLSWITRPELALKQDLLILPGSKATVGDLAHHLASGMGEAIREAHDRGAWVLGICGGYQMLGEALVDEAGSEGGASQWPGLGLLPIRTTFTATKVTEQRSCDTTWPLVATLAGYEIHQGRSEGSAEMGITDPFLALGPEAGLRRGRVLGCYLHGLLAENTWRGALLNEVRGDRGLPMRDASVMDPMDLRLQRWADHLRTSLRPGAWERLRAAVTRVT